MLGFEKRDVPLADHLINGAEITFGIKYPQTYRAMIKDYSGSSGSIDFRIDRPSPGYDYGNIGLLLSLAPWDDETVYQLVSTWREHHLDRRIVPFGVDGSGDFTCFDYRRSVEPEIICYFHELQGDDGILRVCHSYDEFLSRLVQPDD